MSQNKLQILNIKSCTNEKDLQRDNKPGNIIVKLIIFYG